MENYAVEMLHITKRFPGIIANDDVTLQLRKGEIHALLGENGAGKSTLMSVLFGLYQPEEGEIHMDGKKVQIVEPDDPGHYFVGRVHITPILGTHAYTELEMEAICEPWRYAMTETERVVDVNGSTDVVLNNTGVRTMSPIVAVTGTVTLSFDGFSQELTAGTYKLTDLRLRQGDNVIGVTGRGTVTFTYREATL